MVIFYQIYLYFSTQIYANKFNIQVFFALNIKKVCKLFYFRVFFAAAKGRKTYIYRYFYMLEKPLYGSKLHRSITSGSWRCLMRVIITSRYCCMSSRRRLYSGDEV